MGIFFPEQGKLRFERSHPPLDSTATPVVTVKVRLDVYPFWLVVALQHEGDAAASHQRVKEAVAAGDKQQKAASLREELQASLVSITAAVFAIDAFYASVKETGVVPGELYRAWQKNRTARHRRVIETLKLAFLLSHEEWERQRAIIEELFELRAWAVHPPAGFSEPVWHPDLEVGIDWLFAAFSSSNAHAVTMRSLDLIALCLNNLRPGNAPLAEWATSSVPRVNPLVDEWTERYGPLH
jgi:hypothetical protein